MVRSDEPSARGVPVRLVAPAISVEAGVDPVAMDADGVLTPPSDVTRVGWWSQAAMPGSRRGTVLVAGHTVSTGGGVFDRLADLEAGDTVHLRTRSGGIDYTVDQVRDFSKDRLARLAPRLFRRSGRSRLVLVTCSDYSHGSYLGNTVVVAHPSGAYTY